MPRLATARFAPPRTVEDVESLAELHLAPHWKIHGITTTHVDHAEHWATVANSFQSPGSWRAKLVNGSLWVKMLSANVHWTERSSVLQMVRLAISDGNIGDLDFVYVHHDRDPNIHVMHGHAMCNHSQSKRCFRGSQRFFLPLLMNARQPPTTSLPVPDYSWVGWSTHTPPWCELSRTMAAAGQAFPYFSGGLRTGSTRVRLRHFAATSAEARRLKIFELRDVSPQFHTTKWNAAASFGHQVQPLPQETACKYRFLLSVPGYGYSNRLKSLLLCGSVVLHLKTNWNEFFMPLLRDGEHLIIINKVEDIMPTVQRLRANESLARAIGSAGRRLALEQLSMERGISYLRSFLSSYSRLLQGPVTLPPGYTRISCTEDVRKVTRQCECPSGGAPSGSGGLGCAASGPSLKGDADVNASCCRGWDCATDVCAATAHSPASRDTELQQRELDQKVGQQWLWEPPETRNTGAWSNG